MAEKGRCKICNKDAIGMCYWCDKPICKDHSRIGDFLGSTGKRYCAACSHELGRAVIYDELY